MCRRRYSRWDKRVFATRKGTLLGAAITTAGEQKSEEQSLKRKAGRLLFIGIPGTSLDRKTRSMLRRVQPGGVVLFGRNVQSASQVALLNAQIRDAVDHPVLIGVDQEGGL